MIELDYKWSIDGHDLYYEGELICMRNLDRHDDHNELYDRMAYLDQEWPNEELLPNGTYDRCCFLNDLIIPEDIVNKYSLYLQSLE